MLLLRGEPTAALAEMERNTDEGWRVAGLPLALDALGRRSEADRVLAVAEKKLAVIGPNQIAMIYAHCNDLDRAFVWLDRAYHEHDGALALYVKGDPMLKNLQHDPRYKAILRKLKLPEQPCTASTIDTSGVSSRVYENPQFSLFSKVEAGPR
jgi:hypothetical protein